MADRGSSHEVIVMDDGQSSVQVTTNRPSEDLEMVNRSWEPRSECSSVTGTSFSHKEAERSTDTLHSSVASLPGLTGSLTQLTPSKGAMSMEALSYNCHEHNVLSVKNLRYEVAERGLEWWQALSSFQLPFQCRREGGCIKCMKVGADSAKRKVLKGVNFEVQSGQMLAVLGSSGSGKTSLLDVISCNYEGGDVSGDVFINGEPRTADIIKRCSASVRQDDRLLPHLTVRETLNFVAQLKLPTTWSNHEISMRVDNVIAELGLRHVANSKVGGEEVRGISGGERRRVSIGVQLLLDPSILFLDEPTSGLDSFTAHHLMETLAKLARNNRIVMLSIHQPRSDIFVLFDLIMLLSQGDMVYYGKAAKMVDYFTSLGHPCPELTNPCDFYVDLTTVDMKSAERESETSERVKQLVAKFQEHVTVNSSTAESSTQSTSFSGNQSGDVERFIEENSPPHGGIVNPAMTTEDERECQRSNAGDDGQGQVEVKVIVTGSREGTRLRRQSIRISTSVPTELEKPGSWKQFNVLTRRSLKNNLEDYGFLGVQAGEALAMSLLIGLLYYNLGLDQLGAIDRFGLLYIIGALYPYMVILDVIGKYYKERFTIYFEMKDGLYKPGAFFWAKIVSEIPEHIVFIILYGIPVYFMAGMQLKVGLFFQLFGVIFMMVYCSRCVGLFTGALLPTYQMAVLAAQSVFTFFLLSSGFIFNIENLFVGLRWTSYISYLKWGYQAMCLTEMRGLNFTCGEDIAGELFCIENGEEALRSYSLDGNEVWHGVAVTAAEIVVFLALFYISMRFVSQKPHQT